MKSYCPNKNKKLKLHPSRFHSSGRAGEERRTRGNFRFGKVASRNFRSEKIKQLIPETLIL